MSLKRPFAGRESGSRYNRNISPRFMKNLSCYELNKKSLRKSCGRIQDNNLIAGYYRNLFENNNDDLFLRKAQSIGSCFKVWSLDVYRQQRVRNILSVNLCHDKFCKNCQNIISKRRYFKFSPELDKYSEYFDIYHVTFTVLNCSGSDLNSTLDKMYCKFRYIIEYFKSAKKIKGLDFSEFGFIGAVRSLEITVKKINNQIEYHPHFHCLFILKKDMRLKKEYINTYSFSRSGHCTRKFTALEILLQKLWYLVFNDIRVTSSAISNLREGYSGVAEKVKKGEYKEVFKYTLKEGFSEIANSEEVFNVLRIALKGRRIIQGYGVLFGVDFESDQIDEELDMVYYRLIRELDEIEDPERWHAKLEEIGRTFSDDDPVKYISKNSMRREVLENV